MLANQKNLNQINYLSKTTENNISFFSTTNELNNCKLGSNEKRKIFDIFHKKEIECQNKLESNGTNNPPFVYKCIYCEKKYKNLNRFEFHMKIHVSQK